MKKLASAQSMVYTLMDKLGPVQEILVQKDDDWIVDCAGTALVKVTARQNACEEDAKTVTGNITPRYATKKNLHLINFRIIEKSMSAVMNHASTLHATVLAKIGEEEVSVMFDSDAGSSYLCTDG